MTKKASNKKPVEQKTEQSNTVKILTIEEMTKALANANALYIARCKKDGVTPEVNKYGISGNIATAQRKCAMFTETHLREIAAMGINDIFLKGLQDASSIKKPMRIAQTLLFALTGNGQHVQSSVKTFLLQYLAVTVCGAKNRAGMKYAATGIGNNNSSDDMSNTANALKLREKLGGKVGLGSVETQGSVGFSVGGIGESLGLSKNDGRGLPVINWESPVMKKLDTLISKLTDGAIDLIAAQANPKK